MKVINQHSLGEFFFIFSWIAWLSCSSWKKGEKSEGLNVKNYMYEKLDMPFPQMNNKRNHFYVFIAFIFVLFIIRMIPWNKFKLDAKPGGLICPPFNLLVKFFNILGVWRKNPEKKYTKNFKIPLEKFLATTPEPNEK